MDYQQFVIVVKEKVALSLGKDMTLQLHSSLKNNGRVRTGITIFDKQVNLAPTIYLEEYYEQFLTGISIESIVENILEVYHEVKFEHEWQVHTIKNFETIQSKFVFKLIHAQKNEALLRTIPHIPYRDLAIVFYILFDVDENGTATIPITHELLEMWETTQEKVYQIAKKNIATLLPATLKPMQVVIEELTGMPYEGAEEDIMFVLTNSIRNFGASCILYSGILDQIGGLFGENYFILPSSIHEVILIPESKSPPIDVLNDMVSEINETQLSVEEVLADHAYYYDCAKQQLT